MCVRGRCTSDTGDADVDCVVLCRDAVREVVRLLLALNARSHAVSLARQTNVSLADWSWFIIDCNWRVISDGWNIHSTTSPVRCWVGRKLMSEILAGAGTILVTGCLYWSWPQWLQYADHLRPADQTVTATEVISVAPFSQGHISININIFHWHHQQ